MDIGSIGGWLLSLFTTHLTTAAALLLLTGTIGIVKNRNMLVDGRDERKYFEK